MGAFSLSVQFDLPARTRDAPRFEQLRLWALLPGCLFLGGTFAAFGPLQCRRVSCKRRTALVAAGCGCRVSRRPAGQSTRRGLSSMVGQAFVKSRG